MKQQTDFKSFLGLVNYLAKLIPNLSNKTENINSIFIRKINGNCQFIE